jgi:2,5-furandicarboxylate decarboxylase 1
MDRWAKLVVVVDDDVDIRDPGDVAWALATRFRPDRDTVVFDGLEGLVIDPSLGGAPTVSKVGFDATRGTGPEFKRVRVPPAAVERARAILSKSGRGFRAGWAP